MAIARIQAAKAGGRCSGDMAAQWGFSLRRREQSGLEIRDSFKVSRPICLQFYFIDWKKPTTASSSLKEHRTQQTPPHFSEAEGLYRQFRD